MSTGPSRPIFPPLPPPPPEPPGPSIAEIGGAGEIIWPVFDFGGGLSPPPPTQVSNPELAVQDSALRASPANLPQTTADIRPSSQNWMRKAAVAAASVLAAAGAFAAGSARGTAQGYIRGTAAGYIQGHEQGTAAGYGRGWDSRGESGLENAAYYRGFDAGSTAGRDLGATTAAEDFVDRYGDLIRNAEKTAEELRRAREEAAAYHNEPYVHQYPQSARIWEIRDDPLRLTWDP